MDSLYNLTPAEFEQLAGRILEAEGFSEVNYVGGPNNQGVDFTAKDKNEIVAIEVRHRKSPLPPSALIRIFKNLRASKYAPRRLVLVTSAEIGIQLESLAAHLPADSTIRIIDRNEILRHIDNIPTLQQGIIRPALRRSRHQRLLLALGIIGSGASLIILFMVFETDHSIVPTPSLEERIDTVSFALEHLKSLEEELVKIKTDMTETDKATKAIEEEHDAAMRLKQLTDKELSVIRSELRRRSWSDVLLDYLLGFVLGASSSVAASVLLDKWRQWRALESGSS